MIDRASALMRGGVLRPQDCATADDEDFDGNTDSRDNEHP